MIKIRRRCFVLGFLFFFLAVSVCSASVLADMAKELVKKTADSSVVAGSDGWLFLKEELVHVGSGKFWGEEAAAVSRTQKKQYADPLPAILAYKELLAEKGITLYLMAVPPKSLVYADKLGFEVGGDIMEEQAAMYQEFYGLLSNSGVEVIDLLPALLEKRKDSDVYCKTDTHFSAEGIKLFAEAAAAVIKQTEWYGKTARKEYVQSPRSLTIRGDLARMAELPDLEESLELTFVTVKESGQPEISDPASPVILLGDSHTLVFNAGGDLHAKGAGLFDHLSARLGFAVDLLGVRGSGVTPARIKLFQRSKKKSDYLEGKKVLIWCFTARDFTGTGGWREIPVAP